MRGSNLHIDADEETLKRLAEEYEILGFNYKLVTGHLTVFCLPPRKKDAKNKAKKR